MFDSFCAAVNNLETQLPAITCHDTRIHDPRMTATDRHNIKHVFASTWTS